MWIIQKPKKVALWNKWHFEEKNGECAACLKYSVLIFVEKIYIKCNIWRVAVRLSYIWDARFLKVKAEKFSNTWLVTYKLAYVRRDNSTIKFLFKFNNYIWNIRICLLNCNENTSSLCYLKWRVACHKFQNCPCVLFTTWICAPWARFPLHLTATCQPPGTSYLTAVIMSGYSEPKQNQQLQREASCFQGIHF